MFDRTCGELLVASAKYLSVVRSDQAQWDSMPGSVSFETWACACGDEPSALNGEAGFFSSSRAELLEALERDGLIDSTDEHYARLEEALSRITPWWNLENTSDVEWWYADVRYEFFRDLNAYR